jgi:hypothetical protein
MKSLLAASIAWAAATGAFAAGPRETIAVKAALDGGAIHEECQRLEAGAKRSYQWSASAPVDFNVHYHHGDEVFYPVKRDAIRRDSGTFTAKTGEDYCWMWSAKNKVSIQGNIETKIGARRENED